MNELRHYLEMLLDHQCMPGSGECPECRRLNKIYGFLQTELFSTVVYREAQLTPRPAAQPHKQPVNRAAAGPRRPNSL